MSATESSEQVVRFSHWVRFQHQAVTVLFIVLLVTGLPQKWPQYEASRWVVNHVGGIFAARWWHRMAGITFAVLMLAHLATAIVGIISRRRCWYRDGRRRASWTSSIGPRLRKGRTPS